MHPIIYLLDSALGIFNMLLVIWVIISILLNLNILNNYNEAIQKIIYALSRVIEPFLKQIRRYIPHLGNIDISPLILMLLIGFLRYTLQYYFT